MAEFLQSPSIRVLLHKLLAIAQNEAEHNNKMNWNKICCRFTILEDSQLWDNIDSRYIDSSFQMRAILVYREFEGSFFSIGVPWVLNPDVLLALLLFTGNLRSLWLIV